MIVFVEEVQEMLRKLALAAGAAGVVFVALAVIGRFVGGPLLGIPFVAVIEAGTMLTIANSSLLIGIFLYLLSREKDAGGQG